MSSSKDQQHRAVVAEVFALLPVPMVLLDSAGHIVALNPSAERLWEVETHHVRGEPLADALVLLTDVTGSEPLTPWARVQDLARTGQRLAGRVTGRRGTSHAVTVVALAFTHAAEHYTAVVVADAGRALWLHRGLAEADTLDAVTGVRTRAAWEREWREWDRQGGVLAVIDIDDLKGLNDLYGHAAGDHALAIVGQALQQAAAPDVTAFRYGGDEFVVVGAYVTGTAGEAWARAAQTALDRALADDALPVPVSLSVGQATFAAGGLEAAFRAADDQLYAQKGTLLRSERGGRLILRRTQRLTVWRPEDPSMLGPEMEGPERFGPALEETLREQYGPWREEAQTFVQWIQVETGTAVVEVGAGMGRLAIEGGLAEAVGSGGVLLLTDPAFAALEAARRRAAAAQYRWMRFVDAPAEALPLASDGADLVLGAWFLHLCDTDQALREMARVVRVGGRVGLDVPLALVWPPVWQEILAPLAVALRSVGRPLGSPFHAAGDVPTRCGAMGMTVERTRVDALAPMEFPEADRAIAFFRRGGHLAVMMQGVPVADRPEVEAAVYRRLTAVFAETSAAERTLQGYTEYTVVRRTTKDR